ncbi:MAG: L-2-hydroxyglutarate oxidase [Actinomycetota bacterium]|nr:L-2-hydroxyglutarate oxidase [Actinomycetota bacterium]MDA3013543.1 L-2-hydroxyglutarate oxidase [Actinomycetota bacterium]
MNNSYDFIVIGAGIVGASTALELKKQGHQVLILEKEKSPGLHQSGRNSGVIHSGIYYKPNSFKSNLCIRGRELLLEFIDIEKVPNRVEGKLVVDDQISKIEDLFLRAQNLGMKDVSIFDKKEILEKEPYCKFESALYVPQAGVVDYKVVTEKIISKFLSLGGEVKYFNQVNAIEDSRYLKKIFTSHNQFETEFLINCAGLYSDTVAKLDNLEPNLQIIPFRGEYFTIDSNKSKYVNNMIYPIANPNLPFLGIHLTKTIDGNIEAGPNAVLAFAKEGYDWSTFNVKEFASTISYKGMWKLGKKYLKTGLSEMYRSLNKKVFLTEISKFIPDINANDLTPRVSGVRAQAVDINGNLVDDFVFESKDNSLHVLNAPSPAATSSFAIGEYIASKVS